MSDTLIVERGAAGVAHVWLNRPELHNAFDDALIASLTAALRELEGDPAARVVVLGGKGKSFSAGADLNWMKRMAGYSETENRRDAAALAELMRTLDRLAKPTVARVHGAAIAGGMGLVACCDVAVASIDATFCVSEVRLGLIPAVISPYLTRAMGARAARRWFLTAERFDAAEAARIGMVHAAVPAERLDAAVSDIVARLLEAGPVAVREAKELVRRVATAPIDEALIADTAERIARVRASPEGSDGVASFLEKRPPAWRGPGRPGGG